MNAHQRKKQPEKVRRTLLDAAARIATHRGIADVTVDAVCLEAGVTKGAFFHHFPSKASLVNAVFADLLERFETELAEHMAADIEPLGRFSRAYVEAVVAPGKAGSEPLWAALCLSALTDAELRANWGGWLDGQLAYHGEADDPDLRVARLAADGLWLAAITGTGLSDRQLNETKTQLLALTRKPS
ncbi:TetR/AcrR family transcriptional regulator [Ciceribacter sp. L1K22]|uniref:TetR/AcrR family transcriptional regulator n=1 Tax=Ciceribacter sp. L1K22 TaxID=2820275 RepID=UPI001ABE1043|nr:TetR/AcrR family transcriptional regulator [Ciceribacter sp. L1K22]MBO3759665.1 TetR/AcrR family transcriptional regulator [Ciceribacter sp. L1K22]